MKKLQLFLLLLVFTFSGIYARKQFIIKSAHLSKADTVWVFTPTDYKSTSSKTYPLIYLLHGWSGNYL
jgi:predicted alpha/beta superfamily hydrolase